MPLGRFIARQARNPSGWFGRWVAGRMFNKGNAALLEHVLELADPKPDHRILDIGFGPGLLIRWLAERTPEGLVAGVDPSEAMLKVAEHANRDLIASGRVELQQAGIDAIPYADASFDTVCTCNTLYFWPDPAANATEVRRVLRPGGRLLVGFRTREQLDRIGFTRHGFTKYEPEEVEALLAEAGFTEVEGVRFPGRPLDTWCAIARA